MKFFAPWCRACKGLEPKFRQISLNPTNADVVFASFNVQNNKEFVKSLGILALPNIHFYANGETVDNFPCGPSKVPMFRKKVSPSEGLGGERRFGRGARVSRSGRWAKVWERSKGLGEERTAKVQA
jgi:thioredoxin-like negative regulator of GroEL